MKKTFILVFISFAFSLVAQMESGIWRIQISGFKNDTGKALLFLYRKQDAVPSAPYKTISMNIVNKVAEISISNLPFGEYALIVAQDENSNGIIDHRWGFPSEPLGYSNNWKFTMVSGMPSFEKLKVTFLENVEVLKIVM